MQQQIDLYSQVLRKMEIEIGARDVSRVLLKSLKGSVKNFKAKDNDDFCEQMMKLIHILSNIEPKFGILNYQLHKLEVFLEGNICKKSTKMTDKKRKRHVIKKLCELIRDAKKKDVALKRNAETINIDGKTILIHDHSHTVQDLLVSNKRKGQKFHVIIAEQDYEKTHNNIERMHKARIPFQVVPSYMLSHIHDRVDMLFFGALTFKDSGNFVMGPGTHSIISEFHVAKTPIYMFMNTIKFSLWRSKKRAGVFIHKHKRQHLYKPIEYERIKYSHDRVPVEMFTKIVTDKGIFSSSEFDSMFRKQLEKYCREC